MNNGYIEELDATKALTMGESQILAGSNYNYSTVLPILPATTTLLAFDSGDDSVKTVFKSPTLIANVNYVEMRIYELGTYTDAGMLSLINSNRNFPDTPLGSMHLASANDKTGAKEIFRIATIGEKKAGSPVLPQVCYIVKPSTTYLVELENLSTNNADVYIHFNFMECIPQ